MGKTMDYTQYFYHLSAQPYPSLNQDGLAQVASVEHIFKYWRKGDKYLHIIVRADTISFHENAHRDGVSNFVFDQHQMAENLHIVRYIDLSCYDSFRELTTANFMANLSQGLMNSDMAFRNALIEACDDTSLPKLIATFELQTMAFSRVKTYFSHDSLCKIIPYLSISDDEIEIALTKDFNWNQLANHDQSYYDDVITRGLSQKLIDQLKVIDTLLECFLDKKTFENNKLTSLIVSILIVLDKPFQKITDKFPTITLNSHFCIFMIRLGKSDDLQKLLTTSNVVIDGDFAHLIDRSTIYGSTIITQTLLSYWQESHFMTNRYLSTAIACGGQHLNVNESQLAELLTWQKSHCDFILKDAVTLGFALLSTEIIASKPHDKKTLDAAIVLAAENGYLTIVKQLYNQGASLTAHGNWPIKYSNRFNYPLLKSFLLENKVVDARFG